mgnify:CR=1 FL=1
MLDCVTADTEPIPEQLQKGTIFPPLALLLKSVTPLTPLTLLKFSQLGIEVCAKWHDDDMTYYTAVLGRVRPNDDPKLNQYETHFLDGTVAYRLARQIRILKNYPFLEGMGPEWRDVIHQKSA